MAAPARGRLLAFRVNSGSVGSASVGGVAAAGGGSAAGRQSAQSVLCVDLWPGSSSTATHWVPLLVQTSVMSWADGIETEKTMLQLKTKQSSTHRCRARVGRVKFAMRGLYVRIHSLKMNI